MGPIEEHLAYVSDAVRLDAYRRAIGIGVNPGALVADLGCGTGILGLMCLQAGARAVFAIDSTSMIEVARESIARACLSGNAVFYNAPSPHVELAERVDVVICDQVGNFGFDAGIIQDFRDARRRFLKPDGTLIPRRIRLWIAAVESQASYARVEGWSADPVPPELRWIREFSLNSTYPVRLGAADVLTPPTLLGDIDLYSDNERLLSWQATLRAGRSGVLHGLAGWFECELAEGVWMTNSPLAAAPVRRSQAFLPVREPITMDAGDPLDVTILARPDESVVAWTVRMASGRLLRQSTWNGSPVSRDDVSRSDPARVPLPNGLGLARAAVLRYCDGLRTAAEVEAAVLRDHPGLLPSAEAISSFVARVLAKDTNSWPD